MSRPQQLIFFTIVVLVGISLWMTLRRSPQKHALDSRTLAMEFMGRYLAERYPDAKALIISNPFAAKSGRRSAIQNVESAGIEGLKNGVDGKISVEAVEFPNIHPEAAKDPVAFRYPTATSTPLSYLIAEDSFDQMSEAHPQCDLIVSLIGFPAKLDLVNAWTKPGTPRFAMLLPDLRMLGSQEVLKESMASGKLAAVIVEKPGAPSRKEPLKDDPKTEFDRRYILLTPESLDQAIADYEDLFDLHPPEWQ